MKVFNLFISGVDPEMFYGGGAKFKSLKKLKVYV